MLRCFMSGNTFNVKEAIKSRGFKFDAGKKNWTKDALTLTIIQSALEEIEADLERAGIRVSVCKVASNPAEARLVWWKDYGRVSAKMLARDREGEDDMPMSGTINLGSGSVRLATGEILGVSNVQVHTEPRLDANCNLTQHGAMSGRVNVGSMRVETPNHAAAAINNRNPEGEEIVIEIPLWLARQLNCSRVLRGRWVGSAEMREYTRRDGTTRRAYQRHFVGGNEIGGTERCYRCGRHLTDPVSRAVGYGQECCRSIGVSRRVNMDDINNIRVMDELIRAQVVDVWIPTSVVRTRA